MYIAFLILHVISAGVWIALLPLQWVINKLTKRAAGNLGELYLMRASIGSGRLLGNLGGIGILITGGGLVGIGRYGWFPFDTHAWLAYKQIIYIVILAILFALFIPAVKKAARLVGEEMGGPTANMGASTELRNAMARMNMIGMIMNLFVLINIILGEWKPNF